MNKIQSGTTKQYSEEEKAQILADAKAYKKSKSKYEQDTERYTEKSLDRLMIEDLEDDIRKLKEKIEKQSEKIEHQAEELRRTEQYRRSPEYQLFKFRKPKSQM